jgi:hypothetical protein
VHGPRLDPTNDLTFLGIRADKTEIMVATGDDYTLTVVLIDNQTVRIQINHLLRIVAV